MPAPAPAASSAFELAVGASGPTSDAERGGAAHLDGRAFPAQHETGTECEAAGEELDRQNAPPAHRPKAHEGAFDLLHAAAGGFGREAPHQPPGDHKAGSDTREADCDAGKQGRLHPMSRGVG